MKWVDRTGREIHPTDLIAYAASQGDSPTLKFGRVQKLKESKPRWKGDEETHPKLGILSIEFGYDWNSGSREVCWHLQNNGKEVTITPDKVIVVPTAALSPEMLNLLK